mmetsp:Transcript_29603/g.74030  ORF Transcript_29603/g.74030 Transcript_29603/m.74030 type:complete len:259 (-) Transcript_29603:69-845(-)
MASWSERFSSAQRSANLRISGTRPTVEMVMWREPIPRSLRIRRTASITASKLRNGSPIPMKTTLLSRSPRDLSSMAKRAACSKISSEVSWREKPICPVAQKVHPIAQPTCDEMHAVRLKSSYGMRTDSMSAPSPSLHSLLTVPSCESCSCSTCKPPTFTCAANFARSASGRLAITPKSVSPRSYTHSRSCFARNFGCLHSVRSASSSSWVQPRRLRRKAEGGEGGMSEEQARTNRERRTSEGGREAATNTRAGRKAPA